MINHMPPEVRGEETLYMILGEYQKVNHTVHCLMFTVGIVINVVSFLVWFREKSHFIFTTLLFKFREKMHPLAEEVKARKASQATRNNVDGGERLLCCSFITFDSNPLVQHLEGKHKMVHLTCATLGLVAFDLLLCFIPFFVWAPSFLSFHRSTHNLGVKAQVLLAVEYCLILRSSLSSLAYLIVPGFRIQLVQGCQRGLLLFVCLCRRKRRRTEMVNVTVLNEAGQTVGKGGGGADACVSEGDSRDCFSQM